MDDIALTTILAYNLIRATSAVAFLLHNKRPQKISFTSTVQYVLASWMQLPDGQIDPANLYAYLRPMLKAELRKHGT